MRDFPASTPGPSDEELIADALIAAGVPADKAAIVASDSILYKIGLRRAADGFNEMLWQTFGNSPAGVALIRLILGSGSISLREDAARLGCSHVALLRAQKRLRRTFRLPAGRS